MRGGSQESGLGRMILSIAWPGLLGTQHHWLQQTTCSRLSAAGSSCDLGWLTSPCLSFPTYNGGQDYVLPRAVSGRTVDVSILSAGHGLETTGLSQLKGLS